MSNINVKYLIIAVIALSALIVAGASVFSLLNKQKITSTPSEPNQATQSAIPKPFKAPERDIGGSGRGVLPEDE